MKSRGLTYGLTFLTYALIHSFRTSWAYIKPFMQHEPFSFSTQFLGELDLAVLVSLAISLKTIGWVGEKIGHKIFLLIGLGYLVLLSFIVAMLMINGVSQHWAYIFLLCMIGISMCTAWPSCLSIVSKFYSPIEDSFLICVWNGCTQFGDLIAVLSGYAIIHWGGATQGYLILTISLLLLLISIVDWVFLVPSPEAVHAQNLEVGNQSDRQKDIQKEKEQNQSKNKQNSLKQPQKFKDQPSLKQPQQLQTNLQLSQIQEPQQQQVNFLNVWCLPSVLSFVCCFACLKSINAIIMNWLFMYLFSIGLSRLSGVITLGWSISIFIGNLIMGYFNKSTNKLGLLIPLLFSAFVFGYLGVEYQHSGSINYTVLLILSGVCFGGPFGLIGSKVALLLGQHPQIKPKKNALGAIISVMWGFGQFIAAIFVVIIPYIGLRRLFYIPAMLCMISSAILFYEHKKGLKFTKKESIKRREQELREFTSS